MIEFFSPNLTSRQEDIYKHLKSIFNLSDDKMHYHKAKRFYYEPSSIDFIICEPSDNLPYYIVCTAGLSEVRRFETSPRNEIMLLLDDTWKMDFDKAQYNWPFKLLKQIVDSIRTGKVDYTIYSTLVTDEIVDKKKPDFNCVGGIITLPELLPDEFVKLNFEGEDTYFFQLMPISKNQLSKIKEFGGKNFVDYDLHNADGPLMVISQEEKTKGLEPIDKIISHNENNLLSDN